MKINQFVDIGIAHLCVNAATVGHLGVFHNTTPPNISQLVFVKDNDLIIRQGNDYIDCPKDQITDIRRFANKEIYGKHNTSSFFIAVNPKTSEFLDYIELKPGTINSYTGTLRDEVIVCLFGSMTVNDITFKETEFAKIDSGKTINIQVNRDSYGVILRK